MMQNQKISLAVALFLSVALFACGDNATSNTTATDSTSTTTSSSNAAAADTMSGMGQSGVAASKTVVENAVAAPELATLVKAIQAAGLESTLSGAGPFTVFAPTNAAFEKLPSGTLDNLTKPENKDQLTKILTYHVVSGSLTAADLKDGQKLKTVQGQELTVHISNGVVKINDATVSTPNIASSNGVVHEIDAVLMPGK